MKSRTARIAVLIALLVIVLAALLIVSSRNGQSNATITPIRVASGIVTIPAILSTSQRSATARAIINLNYRETNNALRQTNNVVYGSTMTHEVEQTNAIRR
jgi:hypothetical protein